MDQDIVCIGVCINDPATGVCLGCGRGPVDVNAAGYPAARKKNPPAPLSAAQYPLPPQLAQELDNPSD